MRIRAHIERNGWNHETRLYLIETSENGACTIIVDGDGKLILKKIQEGQGDAPCLLTMRGPLGETILTALAEELGKKGFERASESTLRGKVEGMSAHLADLRTLLNLSKGEN